MNDMLGNLGGSGYSSQCTRVNTAGFILSDGLQIKH